MIKRAGKFRLIALVLALGLLCACGSGGEPVSNPDPAPEDPYQQGRSLMHSGDYEDAIDAFSDAIDAEPEQAKLYAARGDAYVAYAESLDPQAATSRIERNYKRAVTDYLDAVRLNAAEPEYYERLAELYRLLDDDPAAAAILRQGYEATGDDALYRQAAALNEAVACAAYLELLLEHRTEILSYDWQKGFDWSGWQPVPLAEATPVAIVDICGDETPELLYFGAMLSETEHYVQGADLYIYGWADGAARLLYSGGLDFQVGGGMFYELFQSGAEKQLWIYHSYGDEWWTTNYYRMALDGAGALTVAETYVYETHPEYTDDGFDRWINEWSHDGTEIGGEEYQAFVDGLTGAARWIMHNYTWDEYDPITDESAMTYDGAVAYLRARLGIETDGNVDETAFFASMPERFSFMSGAGAWSTDLSIAEDGSFTGSYHDSNMGEDGERYPNGTIYYCHFSGRFGSVTRIDDYSYSMRMLELRIEEVPGDVYYQNGVRYVASEPYGIDGAEEVTVYLPGAQISKLPEDFVSWVAMPNAWGYYDNAYPTLLPFWGLYNVNAQCGFFGS